MAAAGRAAVALLVAALFLSPALSLSPRSYLCFFDHGSAELPPACQNVALELVEALQRTRRDESLGLPPSPLAAIVPVKVYGHADAAEAASGKASVSRARAEAVAGFLRLNGVQADVIEIRWFGGSRPLVPTATAVVEPQNRRVEIVPSYR